MATKKRICYTIQELKDLSNSPLSEPTEAMKKILVDSNMHYLHQPPRNVKPASSPFSKPGPRKIKLPPGVPAGPFKPRPHHDDVPEWANDDEDLSTPFEFQSFETKDKPQNQKEGAHTKNGEGSTSDSLVGTPSRKPPPGFGPPPSIPKPEEKTESSGTRSRFMELFSGGDQPAPQPAQLAPQPAQLAPQPAQLAPQPAQPATGSRFLSLISTQPAQPAPPPAQPSSTVSSLLQMLKVSSPGHTEPTVPSESFLDPILVGQQVQETKELNSLGRPSVPPTSQPAPSGSDLLRLLTLGPRPTPPVQSTPVVSSEPIVIDPTPPVQNMPPKPPAVPREVGPSASPQDTPRVSLSPMVAKKGLGNVPTSVLRRAKPTASKSGPDVAPSPSSAPPPPQPVPTTQPLAHQAQFQAMLRQPAPADSFHPLPFAQPVPGPLPAPPSAPQQPLPHGNQMGMPPGDPMQALQMLFPRPQLRPGPPPPNMFPPHQGPMSPYAHPMFAPFPPPYGGSYPPFMPPFPPQGYGGGPQVRAPMPMPMPDSPAWPPLSKAS